MSSGEVCTHMTAIAQQDHAGQNSKNDVALTVVFKCWVRVERRDSCERSLGTDDVGYII